jgi:uncharacterized membrane protein
MGLVPITERPLRIATGVIGLLGVGITSYLLIERARGVAPSCVVGGGCGSVQKSEWAEVAGVPVALLGLLAYLALIGAALIPGQLGAAAGLFTLLVGVGFSAWLTYLEIFEIEAICAWCVASAILQVVGLVVAFARIRVVDRQQAGARGAPTVDPLPGSE